MSFVQVTYASPSAFQSSRDRSDLSISADARRPVAFHGRVVRHGLLLRFALRAVGEAIWSEDHWDSRSEYTLRTLDPVITVHPDRVWFEAFTQDMGAYVSLRLDPELFATEGEVRFGTTNIDFTAWLWGALGEMRTSRPTHFRVGAEGFEVTTQGAGGRFEQKVDLPDPWVRGFLQVQAAMALPGTRLRVRPVDLLAAIRFLQHSKAKVSPRGLRFEMAPGKDAELVLEPWEHRVPLVGAEHGYAQARTIRTWGRRKLKLLESLLPFAEHVDIYLKGRALPSFYAVRLPGMTFLVGLTGTGGGTGFTGDAGLHLLAGGPGDPAAEERVLSQLASVFRGSTQALAEAAGLPLDVAARALSALNRAGRVMFDVEAREWRHRELFGSAVDVAALFPPDPRQEAVAALLEQPDGVRLESVQAEEQVKVRKFRDPETGAPVERQVSYRQWRVRGEAGRQRAEVVVNDEDRIIFGTCGCAWFGEHLMNKGPCEHMLAVYLASEGERHAV